MIFQTLDDKTECVGIYTDNKLIFDADKFPENLSSTWKYSPYLRNMDIEYISLYLEGGTLEDNIPEFLKDDWSDVAKNIQAFKRSLSLARVDTNENCFFDLVPQRFLIEFCEVKNRICEHILKTKPKPKRYGFYRGVAMMLEDLSHRKVNLDMRAVSSYKSVKKLANIANTIIESEKYVKYNQFGTKTGRLTTKKGSFPILTMSKSMRTAVKPTNDYFLELDFNGAEVRTLLGLLGKEQPTGDVHNFHIDEIFSNINDRSAAKVAFFAWLYGSRTAVVKEDVQKLEKFYEKDSLLEKHWIDNTVTTPFGKQINDTSRHHALNYLVQSTAAELTLKQALKLDYLLRTRGHGSQIAFLIHDAVVIDMKNEDEHLIKSLLALMASTNFGQFEVNLSKGKTLGSMEQITIG